MLRTRLLVAAIGLPLLAIVIALPEPVFAAAISLLLAAAAAEMFIAAAGLRPAWQPLGAAAATAFVALWMRQAAEGFPLWTLLPLPAIALYGLLRPGPGPRRLREAWWLSAVAYIGVLGAHWLLLRGEPEGQRWLVVLLGVTIATDTGAYAIGRWLGRHPARAAHLARQDARGRDRRLPRRRRCGRRAAARPRPRRRGCDDRRDRRAAADRGAGR